MTHHFDLSLSVNVRGERIEAGLATSARCSIGQQSSGWAAYSSMLERWWRTPRRASRRCLFVANRSSRFCRPRRRERAQGRETLLRTDRASGALVPSAIGCARRGIGELCRIHARANRLAHSCWRRVSARGAARGVKPGPLPRTDDRQPGDHKPARLYVPLDPRTGRTSARAAIVRVCGHRDRAVPDTLDRAGEYSDQNPDLALHADDTISCSITPARPASRKASKSITVASSTTARLCAAITTAHRCRDRWSSPRRLRSHLRAYAAAVGGLRRLSPSRTTRVLEPFAGERHGAVLMRQTPSHVGALLTLSDAAPRHRRTFVVGGEVFEPAVARRLQAKFPPPASTTLWSDRNGRSAARVRRHSELEGLIRAFIPSAARWRTPPCTCSTPRRLQPQGVPASCTSAARCGQGLPEPPGTAAENSSPQWKPLRPRSGQRVYRSAIRCDVRPTQSRIPRPRRPQ